MDVSKYLDPGFGGFPCRIFFSYLVAVWQLPRDAELPEVITYVDRALGRRCVAL